MTVDRARLASLLASEAARFAAEHPRSKALARRAEASLLGGVPMPWMVRWAGGFPVFAAGASGAHLTDVDGHRYLDLCLGDTGALTGHAPHATVQAVRGQAGRGFTFMLPTEDAVWVGEELSRRFGLPYWQFALTATDANRFAVRLAREITGRPLILVYNWCYHGSVDETFATLREGAGSGVSRRPARDHPPDRHPAPHRRDPHDLRRTRWIHPGPWLGPRPADSGKVDRRWGAGRGLWGHGASGGEDPRPIPHRPGRHRRHWWYAGGQRPRDCRDSRHPRAGAHGIRLWAHHPWPSGSPRTCRP
jgi:hypothetical protein